MLQIKNVLCYDLSVQNTQCEVRTDKRKRSTHQTAAVHIGTHSFAIESEYFGSAGGAVGLWDSGNIWDPIRTS